MAKKVVHHSIEHIDLDKPIISASQIGEIIRSRRTSANMTIEDACLGMQLSKDTLLKIEQGHDGIKLSTLLKIFADMGIELRIKVKGWS